MAVQYDKRILYPEEYIIKEDLKEMGDINIHQLVIDYIKNVLKQLYKINGWTVLTNINITHPAIRNSRNYIVPDIALIKAVLSKENFDLLRRWNGLRQPPSVVVEISSSSTWRHDVENDDDDKPAIYGRIGVTEYFVYDPNTPPVWKDSKGVRLRGWRFEDQQPKEIEPDALGRLWSEELQSYFVPAGTELHLTDINGNRRLTEHEFDKQARQQAELDKEREALARQKAEQALEQSEVARQQAELDKQQTQQALEQSELARQQEALARQQEAQARQQAELAQQEAERRLAELLKQLEKNKE